MKERINKRNTMSNNKKLGIDIIKFYTPGYALNLSSLATVRGETTDKYQKSFGQEKMSVTSIDEDIVTMSASAASLLLEEVDKSEIGFLILATETGVDASKSAGMFIHGLLNLPKDCRVLELKQACYSATGGIALALPFLQQNPDKKVLLVAADIAQYTLCSKAESSGGAAAVAMILSTEPRILEIEKISGVHTEDSMDFWRPHYTEEPILNSKLSCSLYMKFLCKSFDDYLRKGGKSLDDMDYFCYHLSVPKLITTAHKYLYKHVKASPIGSELLARHINASSEYGKLIGNCYAASLYLSFISLLDNAATNLAGKTIAFYSYGSGSIAEFFSGTIRPGYRNFINTKYNQDIINKRTEVSVKQYESWHQYSYPKDGSKLKLPIFKKDGYRLAGFEKHMRIYEKTSQS